MEKSSGEEVLHPIMTALAVTCEVMEWADGGDDDEVAFSNYYVLKFQLQLFLTITVEDF